MVADIYQHYPYFTKEYHSKMPLKRCAWGPCNSDSRYMKRDYMEGVEFYRFPRPVLHDPVNLKTITCREWIKACNRSQEQLNINKIINDYEKDNRCFFICSKVSMTILSL